MKLDKVAASGNDEFYTPRYAVAPILPFLSRGRVWCPFDTEESHFVSMLRDEGHEVVPTHLDHGQDFFDLVQDSSWVRSFDYAVSNPPYSKKGEVLRTLFRAGVPFAMLVAIVGLFESQSRFEMFRDHRFEILYLNRRVAYFRNYADEKPDLNPPFSSAYVCSGILPEQVCFAEIDKRKAA